MRPPTVSDLEAAMLAASASDNHSEADRLGRHLDHQPRPTPTLLGAALWYAEQGLHVFPLQPGQKLPMRGSRGCHDATDNTHRVRQWWTKTPAANVAIATNYLVDVIDIDGTPGALSWARYADDLPPIVGRVSTPRPGGNHLYVHAVPGRGNKAGLLPSVDYRGMSGYVVAPPSVITDGPNPGTYEWHRPLDVAALTKGQT